MNKKQLTERNICTKFITPALEQSNWDIIKHLNHTEQTNKPKK